MTKADLRARAAALRLQGMSVPAIAVELGVARSTAFLWTKDISREGGEAAVRRRKAHSKAMTDARWGEHRVETAADKAALHAASIAEIGALTDREKLLVGVALYWAEGAKAKPWRPYDWPVIFTNSDVGMVAFFIEFLELCGYSRFELTYRLSIHESADVEAAMRWWARGLGLASDALSPPTLKRHKPSSNRHNAGADYHGCMVVRVRKPTRLYWRIEGMISGLIGNTFYGDEPEALS